MSEAEFLPGLFPVSTEDLVYFCSPEVPARRGSEIQGPEPKVILRHKLNFRPTLAPTMVSRPCLKK